MSEVISPKWEIVATGNPDVDCILNYEFSKAMSSGILINSTISIPTTSLIKAFDLNIILTNLVDNAIEASSRCEVKDISFTMRYKSKALLIYITNHYIGTIKTYGDKFISNKEDKKNHGLGIESVRTTVDKYGGISAFEYSNGVFTATVNLPIEESELYK